MWGIMSSIDERLRRWCTRGKPDEAPGPDRPESIEEEDLSAWLVRYVNQPGRKAFNIFLFGRTKTMPDGTKKPAMGITARIWWN